MTSKQKIFSILSLTLLVFVACGKHPISKPTATTPPDDTTTQKNDTSTTKPAIPLVVGGESATGSKVGSKVFKGVVAALSKTGATQDDVIDSILTNINAKFSKDFTGQNFLVAVATIDADKSTATLSNLNIFDGKDGIQTSAFSLLKKDKKYTATQIVDDAKKPAATLKIAGQDVTFDNSDPTKASKAKPATISAKSGAYPLEGSINGTAVHWNLPVFKIADENKMIKDPIELDLSKKDSGYSDPISIETLFFDPATQSVECVLIHTADAKVKGDSTAIFTNFLDVTNNQITFKSFESDKLEGFSKLYSMSNMPVNMVCFAMDVQDGKNINVFAITQVKTNIKFGASTTSTPAPAAKDLTSDDVTFDNNGVTTISGTCVTGQKVKVAGDDVDDVPEVDCKDGKYTIPNVKLKANALTKKTAPAMYVKSKDAKGVDIKTDVKIAAPKSAGQVLTAKADKTANTVVSISGNCTPGSTITLSGTDISGTPPTGPCTADPADATKGIYKIDSVNLNTVADGVAQKITVTETKDGKSAIATADIPKAIFQAGNTAKPATPSNISPADGTTVTSSTVTITGNCSTHNNDISITGDNLTKPGAGICDDTLKFSIAVTVKTFPVTLSVTEVDPTSKAISDAATITLNKKAATKKTTAKKTTTGSKKK